MRIRTIRAAVMLGAALGAALASAAASHPAVSGKSAVAASAARVGVHPNTVVFGGCGENYHFVQTTNTRSGAGTWNAIVGKGQPGQWFQAEYETSYYYSGYRWVYGQDNNTMVDGWVAVELLHDDGPIPCTF